MDRADEKLSAAPDHKRSEMHGEVAAGAVALDLNVPLCGADLPTNGAMGDGIASGVIDLVAELYNKGRSSYRLACLDGTPREVSFRRIANSLFESSCSVRTMAQALACRGEDFWRIVVIQIWALLDAAMVCVLLDDDRGFANSSANDLNGFRSQLDGAWLPALTPVGTDAVVGAVTWYGPSDAPRLSLTSDLTLIGVRFCAQSQSKGGRIFALLDDRTRWAVRFPPGEDDAAYLRAFFLTAEGLTKYLPMLLDAWRTFDRGEQDKPIADRPYFATAFLDLKQEVERAPDPVAAWLERTPSMSALIGRLNRVVAGKIRLPTGEDKVAHFFLVGEASREGQSFSYLFDGETMLHLLDPSGPFGGNEEQFFRLWKFAWTGRNGVVGRFDSVGDYPIFVPDVEHDPAVQEYAKHRDPEMFTLEGKLLGLSGFADRQIAQSFQLPLAIWGSEGERWSVPLVLMCLVPRDHTPLTVRDITHLVEAAWGARPVVQEALQLDHLHRQVHASIWREAATDFAHILGNHAAALGPLIQEKFVEVGELETWHKTLLAQAGAFLEILGWMVATWELQGLVHSPQAREQQLREKGSTVDVEHVLRHVIDRFRRWRRPEILARHDGCNLNAAEQLGRIDRIELHGVPSVELKSILPAPLRAIVLELLWNYVKHGAADDVMKIVWSSHDGALVVSFQNMWQRDPSIASGAGRGMEQLTHYVHNLLGGAILFPIADDRYWTVRIRIPVDGVR